MKKYSIFLLFLSVVLCTYGQMRRGGRGMNTMPPTNTEPSEREIEKRKQEAEERRIEFIDNFLTTLEADEFQKGILKQNIADFYAELVDFSKLKFDSSIAQKEAYETFRNQHFEEIKSLISEVDSAKLDEFLLGKFDEKKVKKEERKKRKRKSRKNKTKDKD